MRTTIAALLFTFIAAAAHAGNDGRVRCGIQFAFASEQGHLFGSGNSSHTQLFMLQPQVSVALVRRPGNKPVIELVNEVTVAESLWPYPRRTILTVNDGFRFHLWPTHPVGGYTELGAGIGSSALHVNPKDPDPRNNPTFRQLSGWLQYHLQVGAGLRFAIGDSRMQVGYRLTHFSNNRTQLPNFGLNLHTITFSWQLPPF